MKVLHAAALTWKDLSGPNASVPGLVAAQHALPGVQAGLLTTLPGHDPPPCSFPVFTPDRICRRSGRFDLPGPFTRPDLVVFHSTYIPLHARIARHLRRSQIPYLICPRGGMTRYAQACKRWKKRAGNLLFFNHLVRGARAVHCLTAGEADASGDWRTPTFVLGNGVHLPDLSLPRLSVVNRPRRITFMGRLHIDHKGLDLLVDACRIIHNELTDAGVVVELFGPDCDGSARQLAQRIARQGAGEIVTLRGPVTGKAKQEMLASTDVFVHPSRTEGHPIAVLEALAHGAPCLLTPNTNMADEVVAAGAGWQVSTSAEGVAEGLTQVLGMNNETLTTASLNARHLAESRYAWHSIAAQSLAIYANYAA